jgi:hypothetical protein
MYISEISAPAFSQAVQEKVRFGLTGRVSRSFLHALNVNAEVVQDFASDDIVYRVTGFVASKDVSVEQLENVTETHSFPKSWWDYTKFELKDRSPRWLRPLFAHLTVRRYEVPVKHVTRIERHCCPHIETPSNDMRHFVFMVTPVSATKVHKTRLVATNGRAYEVDTSTWGKSDSDPFQCIDYAMMSLVNEQSGQDVEFHISTTDARLLSRHPVMRKQYYDQVDLFRERTVPLFSIGPSGLTRSGIPRDFLGFRVIEFDDAVGAA